MKKSAIVGILMVFSVLFGCSSKEDKFEKSFGVPFPKTKKERDAIRGRVVEKLFTVGKSVKNVSDGIDNLNKILTEEEIKSPEDLAKKANLQREKDKFSSEITNLKDDFSSICSEAREAGFKEEVNLVCPDYHSL